MKHNLDEQFFFFELLELQIERIPAEFYSRTTLTKKLHIIHLFGGGKGGGGRVHSVFQIIRRIHTP